ncbi:hypothetical protein Q4Q35_11825 [Flavivirga aquimarina]|uniref:Uncharacterized protein n=1 Tax=Flavivirga aquimarina TaxID=2027862 RepID=A0ABT8WBI2_9FLAO|nr:hypothetical protein [Flavivirga aquimarina]MDO5970495.1 hypothetical protein [Flavivirga aquimarina]
MAKKIQHIGLGIHTLPDPESKNFKSLSDQTQDYKARISLLKTYLNKLYEDEAIERNAIKVVTLPQFFFRGKTGAYSINTIIGNGVSDLNSHGLLGSLQELVMDKKWKNWIFNFGTIIGYNEELEEEEDPDNEKVNKTKTNKNGEDNEDEDKEEEISTSDSIDELLRKEKIKEKRKLKSGKDNEDEDEEEEISTSDSIDDLLRKAQNNQNIKEKRKTKNNKEGEEEDGDEREETDEKEAFELSKGEDSDDDNEVDDDDDESEEGVDIEIKEAFHMCILINGGFITQKKATIATTVVVAPYKVALDSDTVEEDTIDSNMVIDLIDNEEDFTLNDDTAIDHWGFIKGDGTIDEKKVKTLKKNTKKDHNKVLQNKLRKTSGKNVLPIPATLVPIGIVNINKLFFALDLCFDHVYQITKKLLLGLTDKKVKLDLKNYLPKTILSPLKSILKSGVHIHLVSSYGTIINKKAVIAKAKGWVVNTIPLAINDGHASKMYQVATCAMEKDTESTWVEDKDVEVVKKMTFNEDTITVNDDEVSLSKLFDILEEESKEKEENDDYKEENKQESDGKEDALSEETTLGKAVFYIHKSVMV